MSLESSRAPERKILPHAAPPWVEPGAIFFLTVCCAPRSEDQLCNSSTSQVIFESIAFRQQRGDWFVHLMLLMPDHLHALVSFPRHSDMKKSISGWKEFVAKRSGVRWQRDFFDHRLRTNESYEEKAHYIRMNPVRKNLVATPEQWEFLWEP